MKSNLGTTDRVLRVLVAVVIAVLYGTGVISGTIAIVLSILAVVFVLTSAINFCPLYTVFGISTRKVKKND
jgi:hypothetical protein